MRETPRPQGPAGGTGPVHPQPRPGRALAHTTGASGSGIPHRSDGRSPQTPRGARYTGRGGRLGTSPPVPGRPFPYLLLGFLLPALFATVTWQVAAGGPLRNLDERASHRLAVPRVHSPVATFCTQLGNIQVAVSVLAVAAGWTAWRSRRWLPPLTAALVMAIVPALVLPLKTWIARPGPTGPLVDYPGFYPSGHAATAAVAYGAATLLLLPSIRRPLTRRVLVAATVALNLAVGAALVRRGDHWPLDVIGSWCMCGTLLWAVSGPLLGRFPRRPRAWPAPGSPDR